MLFVFKFSHQILGMSDFAGFLCVLIIQEYYNIHKEFKIHITNIFVLGAKTNIARWQPPPLLTLTSYPILQGTVRGGKKFGMIPNNLQPLGRRNKLSLGEQYPRNKSLNEIIDIYYIRSKKK